MNLTNVHHSVHSGFLTPQDCETIETVVLKYHDEVCSIPNNNKTDYTGTTAQHNVYNWIYNKELEHIKLHEKIVSLPEIADYKYYRIQCWANVLWQGQNINSHVHHTPNQYSEKEFFELSLEDRGKIAHTNMMACSVFISGVQPCYTHFEDKGRVENIIGTLHMVGSSLRHEVKTNVNRQPRISMAFDVFYSNNRDFRECDGALNLHEPLADRRYYTVEKHK